MVGKKILQYNILEKLGEGGMGVVYKAYDTKLNRTVALKFLPSQLIHDDETRKRFIHEARAASALDHPNIGTIFEINENIETPFISMAYYGGKTLKEKIAGGKIDIEQAIQITIKITDGLKKANSKNIIHRDIKPANIIFTDDGEIKIIDFGLAKLMINTALTQTGTVMGTLGYMSPELLQGSKVDHRTDIWSLGVVLYEMLTGKSPFQGEFDQAIMYNIINEEPEYITKLNSDIPIQIEKIINKALSKDPKKRFYSMDEMEEALLFALKEYRSGKTTIPFIHKLGRKQLRMIKRLSFIFLFLAAITTYWWFNSNATSKPVSIAILPMENISNNSDQKWLADGMTDALITDLAKIGGLRVISRSSVMGFKGKEKTISEIAQELGVEYLVESSVSKIGDQIKISARLVDAPGDRYVWADDYERAFSNVLALQGEIAQTIANQIQVKLTPQEQRLLTSSQQVNPEAYEAYLKGESHTLFGGGKETPADFEAAMSYFERALKKEPDYAPAYAGIAAVWQGRIQMTQVPPSEGTPKAKQAVEKALTLDSTLAEAYGQLANIQFFDEWDYQAALVSAKRAIELSPNDPLVRATYSQMLLCMRRTEEAISQAEHVLELDPLNDFTRAMYGEVMYHARRYDDAIVQCRRTLEKSPNQPIARVILGASLFQKGMYAEALEVDKNFARSFGDEERVELEDRGYAHGGFREAMRQVAEVWVRRSRTIYISPLMGPANSYARAGDKERTLEWLEKAYEEHSPNLPFLNCDPLYDFLRGDPQFQNLLKRMGLQK